jgi:hypothetical protein
MPLHKRWRTALIVAASVAGSVAIGFGIRKLVQAQRVRVISGAVIVQNEDPHLQRPILNATISAKAGAASHKSMSGDAGFFRVELKPPLFAGEMVELVVEHPDYRRFASTTPATDRLYVIRLEPEIRPGEVSSTGGGTRISNVRVRYATLQTTTTNVGTAVKTFAIANKGNVPCEGRPPCSPDGKWKAAIESFSLDTEEENKHFRNVRVSCIAGPCPFSRIETDRFSRGGRVVNVSVRNWSDTVTYVVEAEVTHTMDSEMIRYTYPVAFGRSMTFTLPAVATGPSIEADIDGTQIVFPLGPQLRLSWADCRLLSGSEGTKQYRCELRPGYRLEEPSESAQPAQSSREAASSPQQSAAASSPQSR